MIGAGFSLIDGHAAVIVFGGTVIASALASGWAAFRGAVADALCLLRAPLDEGANRAALARLAYAIERKGRFAAEAPLPPDPALAEMVAAYLRMGEVQALREARRIRFAAARTQRNQTVAIWRQTGELAPVAGLAGTLYAIAQLAPVSGDGAFALATAHAVGTAVISTFYGLLFAHLVCLPLAGAMARRAQAEQALRTRLIDWFESQLPTPAPQSAPRLHESTAVLVEAA